MKQDEKEELQEELKKNGIYLTDFISSSTYDAVVNMLHKAKQLPTQDEIWEASQDYKNNDPIKLNKANMDSSFLAGAFWLMKRLNQPN